MRLLLDTNIYIHREDYKVIDNNLQELFVKLNQLKTEILIHPLSIKELKEDPDRERMEIVLSKVLSYPLLESPPIPINDIAFKNRSKWDGEKNLVDFSLLYAIYKNAVQFLITEDRGIHKSAKTLNLDDRVFLIEEALYYYNQIKKEIKFAPPPALKEVPLHNLDLTDPLFDSLREEYPNFDEWFNRIARKGRKCLAYFRTDDSLGAILIYKIEDEAIHSIPALPKRKRLKLCTFKVTHVGYKIGELFIKLSVDFALKNDITQLYLTHFTKPYDRLTQLITEYGFYFAAKKENNEDIYIKDLIVPEGYSFNLPIDVTKKYYPSFYDGLGVKKFIIPIQPEYHSRLFTDYSGRQTILDEHSGDFIIEGNTIKKAYLTHSQIKKIDQGAIVLFYRSQDLGKVTSLGVVESVHLGKQNPEEIMTIVGKRTVYSEFEIINLTAKPVTVLIFSHHFHLRNPLNLKQLKDIGALSSAPQSIVEINHRSYRQIKRMGEIDERFTFN